LETVQKAANQVSGAIAAWNSAPAPEPLVGPTSSELDRELSELPAAPVGDLSPSPAIIDADTKLEAARQALPAHLAARPEPALALPTELSAPNLREIARDLRTDVPAVDPKLQDEHATLERRLAATPERRVSVPLLIAAGLAAAAAAIGGFLTTPLLTIAGLAVAAGLVAVAVRHVLKDPRAPLLASLRDLEARLATAEAAAAAAQIKISEASARAQAIGLPAEPGVLESLARKVDEITAAVERLLSPSTARTARPAPGSPSRRPGDRSSSVSSKLDGGQKPPLTQRRIGTTMPKRSWFGSHARKVSTRWMRRAPLSP